MTDFIQHTLETAPDESKPLLQGVQEQFQFIPIMFGHMAEAPASLRAALAVFAEVSKTSLTPAQQQVAMLAASTENECANCTAAHRALGAVASANPQTLESLPACAAIVDPVDRALSEFTQAVVRSRGTQGDRELDAFLNAGFTRQQALEVILIVAFKTLTNYTNHLTDSPADPEMLAMLDQVA